MQPVPIVFSETDTNSDVFFNEFWFFENENVCILQVFYLAKHYCKERNTRKLNDKYIYNDLEDKEKPSRNNIFISILNLLLYVIQLYTKKKKVSQCLNKFYVHVKTEYSDKVVLFLLVTTQYLG